MTQTSGSACGLPRGFGLITARPLGFKSKPSVRSCLGEEELQENSTEAARLFLTWFRGQPQNSTDSPTFYWLQAITQPRCKGRDYSHTSRGLRQDHTAEGRVGGRLRRASFETAIRHARKGPRREVTSDLTPRTELQRLQVMPRGCPVWGQARAWFTPRYSFVIGHRLPLGEHKFPDTSVPLRGQTEQILVGWGQPCDNMCDRDARAGPRD